MLYKRVVKPFIYSCIGWIGEACCGVEFEIEKAARSTWLPLQLGCWVCRPFHRSQAPRMMPLVCYIIVLWRRRRCNHWFICIDATDETTYVVVDLRLKKTRKIAYKEHGHDEDGSKRRIPDHIWCVGGSLRWRQVIYCLQCHKHRLQWWWTSSGSNLHISTHLEQLCYVLINQW